MNIPILKESQSINLQEFIDYWSSLYDYSNEHLYNERINKSEYSEDDIQQFYIWKNGMLLSEKKQISLEKNIKSKLNIINNLNLRFYTRTYKPYVDRLFLCKKEEDEYFRIYKRISR